MLRGYDFIGSKEEIYKFFVPLPIMAPQSDKYKVKLIENFVKLQSASTMKMSNMIRVRENYVNQFEKYLDPNVINPVRRDDEEDPRGMFLGRGGFPYRFGGGPGGIISSFSNRGGIEVEEPSDLSLMDQLDLEMMDAILSIPEINEFEPIMIKLNLYQYKTTVPMVIGSKTWRYNSDFALLFILLVGLLHRMDFSRPSTFDRISNYLRNVNPYLSGVFREILDMPEDRMTRLLGRIINNERVEDFYPSRNEIRNLVNVNQTEFDAVCNLFKMMTNPNNWTEETGIPISSFDRDVTINQSLLTLGGRDSDSIGGVISEAYNVFTDLSTSYLSPIFMAMINLFSDHDNDQQIATTTIGNSLHTMYQMCFNIIRDIVNCIDIAVRSIPPSRVSDLEGYIESIVRQRFSTLDTDLLRQDMISSFTSAPRHNIPIRGSGDDVSNFRGFINNLVNIASSLTVYREKYYNIILDLINYGENELNTQIEIVRNGNVDVDNNINVLLRDRINNIGVLRNRIDTSLGNELADAVSVFVGNLIDHHDDFIQSGGVLQRLRITRPEQLVREMSRAIFEIIQTFTVYSVVVAIIKQFRHYIYKIRVNKGRVLKFPNYTLVVSNRLLAVLGGLVMQRAVRNVVDSVLFDRSMPDDDEIRRLFNELYNNIDDYTNPRILRNIGILLMKELNIPSLIIWNEDRKEYYCKFFYDSPNSKFISITETTMKNFVKTRMDSITLSSAR